MRGRRRWLFAIAFILIGAVLAGIVLKSRHAQDVPGRAVTRLLTADQYRNIVADVFGDDIDLGGRLEPDLRADGLLAVGAAQVSIAPAGMEQYDAMARAVASQILDANHRADVMPCRAAAGGLLMSRARARSSRKRGVCCIGGPSRNRSWRLT